ncbi:MAG: glycosyltransferase [Polyangiaceae bacterium]
MNAARQERGSSQRALTSQCPREFAAGSRVFHRRMGRSPSMEPSELAAALGTAASAATYIAVQGCFHVAQLLRQRRVRAEGSPSVTILKPLSGHDDALADNLDSFAHLEHPDCELLLGLASPADAAAPAARAFLARHPGLDARIVFTDAAAATNPKVAQLIGLTRAARGDVLVVSDSNVRATPDYLRNVLDSLLQPGVGVVSCLVAGGGERTLGAAVENAQLCAYVAPAVSTAHVCGRPITVGKTMAMRRGDMERAGGWGAVGDVLAEDEVLGRRFEALGFGVALCAAPVLSPNTEATLARTLERHTRWAKMRRALSPVAFAAEPVLQPAIVAALGMLVSSSMVAVQIWLAATGLQVLGTAAAVRRMRGRWPRWGFAGVELVRMHVAFACWLGACVSRRVEWRGNAFLLGRGSQLVVERPGRSVRRWTRAILRRFAS